MKPIDMKEIRGYKIRNAIGKGQYGEVLHAQNDAGIDFAIKVVPLNKLQINPKLSTFFNQETHVLLLLTHPNIIEFIESFKHDNSLWIIYEYCNNGSIKQKLNDYGSMNEMTSLYVV